MKILPTMMALASALPQPFRRLERRPGNAPPVASPAPKPADWNPADPIFACGAVYDGETVFAERDPRLVGLRAARRKGWVVLSGSGPITAGLTEHGIEHVEEHRARAR